MAPLREAMLHLLKTWERVQGAHGLHKHTRNTGTRTRGSSQPGGCSGVRALLVPDPERPCLCSASVTSERPPLESLIWLLLPRFGAACSPGQAELVNVTLRRRKGETPRCHPAQQRRQEGSERVASCEQQVGEARGEGGEARQMNSIALLLLRQMWLSWQGDTGGNGPSRPSQGAFVSQAGFRVAAGWEAATRFSSHLSSRGFWHSEQANVKLA